MRWTVTTLNTGAEALRPSVCQCLYTRISGLTFWCTTTAMPESMQYGF